MPNNPDPRRVDVADETGPWQEYDRTVRVSLHHNEHQATILRLNRAEAEALLQALSAHLKGTARAKTTS